MWHKLDRCKNIVDITRLARNRLPRPIYDYVSAGSGSERTLRWNTDAYDEITVTPRAAVDVSKLDTSITLFGRQLSFPLMVAPVGGIAFVHPDTELDIARAAARAGIMVGLSNYSAASLESVAEACGEGPRLFQIYDFADDRLIQSLIQSARDSRYDVMCITIDCPVPVPRARLDRWSLWPGVRPPLATTLALMVHPIWGLNQLRNTRRHTFDYQRRISEWRAPTLSYHRADLSWKRVEELIKLWNGPTVVKGVLIVGDAHRAVDAGAAGIIICNHGGTALDGAPATISILGEIADAIGSTVDVVQCGGLRSGDGILKALAMGAKAVMTGRPFVYGSAAGRQAGVQKVIEILRKEFEVAMQLSGCRSVAEIDRSMIGRLQTAPRAWS